MKNLLVIIAVCFTPIALACAIDASTSSRASAQASATPAGRTIDIVVDGEYQPSRIVVQQGERVRLRFVRRDYGPCTREVVFESLGIRRELPTNQPVEIELPALTAGEHEFHCGMNMIRGTIVVQAS